MAQRWYQGAIDQYGDGQVIIGPAPTNLEWDIYRISVEIIVNGTSYFVPKCQAEIRINDRFLCWSPMGAKDTAIGPPDVVISSSDLLTVTWAFCGTGLEDTATDPHSVQGIATIYYNENPQGTTYSTAH